MADLSLTKPNSSLIKSFGDTYVADGGNVHLGDILHPVKVDGGLHFHYKAVRRKLPRKGFTKNGPRRKDLKSLTQLQRLLQRVEENAKKAQSHDQNPVAACIAQLAAATRVDINEIIHRENTLRTASASNTSVSVLHERLEAQLDVLDNLLAKNDLSLPPNTWTTRFQLVLILPTLGLSKQTLNMLLSNLQTEVLIICALLRSTLSICLIKLAILGPQFLVLFRTIRHLPRLLQAAPDDVFIFHDAINNIVRLPVADFQHWEVFKARLDCKFRGTPGEALVHSDHYTLYSGREPITPDATAWSGFIKPNVKIFMAANVGDVAKTGFPEKLCPNPSCGRDVRLYMSLDTSMYKCSSCGINFSKTGLPWSQAPLAQSQIHKVFKWLEFGDMRESFETLPWRNADSQSEPFTPVDRFNFGQELRSRDTDFRGFLAVDAALWAFFKHYNVLRLYPDLGSADEDYRTFEGSGHSFTNASESSTQDGSLPNEYEQATIDTLNSPEISTERTEMHPHPYSSFDPHRTDRDWLSALLRAPMPAREFR